jgi:hypothetical protein
MSNRPNLAQLLIESAKKAEQERDLNNQVSLSEGDHAFQVAGPSEGHFGTGTVRWQSNARI